MKTSAFRWGAAVAILGVIGIYVRGGDLNPPPGPISSSMHTMDDVYAAILTQKGCDPCPWSRITVQGPPGHFQGVLLGKGLVHEVLLAPTDSVTLDDATSLDDVNDSTYIGIFVNEGGTAAHSMRITADLHYTQGLFAIVNRNDYGRPINVFYRPE